MSFLLDTDICSAHLRRPSGLAHRFLQHSGRLSISAVTLAEMYAGAYHLHVPDALLASIADLLEDVPVIDFDPDSARQFGMIRGALPKRGISIPTADLMIAATALCHELTLVTHNVADYAQIPNLLVVDWLSP